MTGLKWFAGGKERREQAVAIIDEVIETIGDKPDYADLKQVLYSYRTELADSRSATPYILSRMSLEISEVVRKDQLTLSPFIEERMAELRKLLAIRYGYWHIFVLFHCLGYIICLNDIKINRNN